jgi:Zinc finger, C2H2 type
MVRTSTKNNLKPPKTCLIFQADSAQCHCCLLDQIPGDTNVSFISMNTTFQVDSSRSVSLLAAYLELNQLMAIKKYDNCDLNICRECTIQLENAYTFRELCRQAEEWRTPPIPPEPPVKEEQQERPETPKKPPKTTKSPFKCPQCQEVSTSAISFKAHRLMHKAVQLPSGAFSCSLCARVYVLAKNFRVHFRMCHLPPKRVVGGKQKCPKCPKLYSAKYLYMHMKSVHQKVRMPCKLCTKVFTFSSSLSVHMKEVHSKERTHKKSKKPTTIAAKNNNNSGSLTKRYTCELCRKDFTYKSGLNVHVRAIHQKVVNYCDLCPNIYKYKTDLAKHKRQCHGKVFQIPH